MLPLEVFKHIFDYFSVREYRKIGPMPSCDLLTADLTPFLSPEARATLHSLSLTCKSFNELARAISLKDSVISSFADFAQLRHMARHCRILPIETLNIAVPESSHEPIRDITGSEFLSVMKYCVRLRGLRMSIPILTSSRLPRAFKLLTQYGTFAPLKSLELFMPDHVKHLPLPDPNDVAQVLLLMPNLKMLHIYTPSEPDPHDNPHETSNLSPPPFQLEYLVISDEYLNLEWLTSTSHNHLRVAHFTREHTSHPFLNLDHPWPKLRYLNLIFCLSSDTGLETFHLCPNLAFLTLETGRPMSQYEENRIFDFFDALQHPLTRLTIASVDFPSGSEGEEMQFTMMATAIENHPILSELTAVTLEIQEAWPHKKYYSSLNRNLPLLRVCEARGIQFTVVCDTGRDFCDFCGTPGYAMPLPDVL